MNKVILISPPYMKLSIPTYDMPLALTKGCNYMNPGLLISSAILDEHNIDNKIIKVNGFTENDMVELIKSIDNNTILVGISCTCSWEYLESLKIAEIIKHKYPNIKILLSGWQVKSIKDKVFKDSEFIDYIITGDAEYTILKLYNSIVNKESVDIPTLIEKNKPIKKNNIKYPSVDFKVLDFTKFPNYQYYIPFVEESRNCPYNCKFCLNSCVNDYYQFVPFEIFKKNVENIESAYGPNAQANLLAANFGVNYKETKRKLEFLKTKKMTWNIELHVDNHWEYYIDNLKEAGITKASIGFESGSVTILKQMNKTVNPSNYLDRMRKLLIALNNQGIKPSINLLFDYRETPETMNETLEFLRNNKEYIKKVKGNFMFAFEGIINNINEFNSRNVIVDDYGKKIHAYPILPKGINLSQISKIISEIELGNYDFVVLDNFEIESYNANKKIRSISKKSV